MTPTGKLKKELSLTARATRAGITVKRVRNACAGSAYGYAWRITIPARVTGGERIRRQFPATQARQAVNFAEGAAARAKGQGEAGFSLSVGQLGDAQKALRLLEPLGLSLEAAAREAIRHLRPAGGDVTLGDLRDRLLAEKRGEGLRPAALQGLRYHTGALVDQFGVDCLVKSINYDQLRAWLDTVAAASGARNVRNHARYAGQFFSYAAAHGYVAVSPAANLRAPRLDEKMPAILSISEAKKLLRVAVLPEHRAVLPALTFSLFVGGLRSAEVARLDWRDVDLKRRRLTVRPEVAKTRDARFCEIPTNAVEFLLLHPDRSGPIAPPQFRLRMGALHRAAGFKRWKDTHANSARHSFGSYGCALHGPDWTFNQMGNSAAMLLKFYRNSHATEEEAREYFALAPGNVGAAARVVPISARKAKTG